MKGKRDSLIWRDRFLPALIKNEVKSTVDPYQIRYYILQIVSAVTHHVYKTHHNQAGSLK